MCVGSPRFCCSTRLRPLPLFLSAACCFQRTPVCRLGDGAEQQNFRTIKERRVNVTQVFLRTDSKSGPGHFYHLQPVK